MKKSAVLIGLIFLIVGYQPAPVFSSDIISFGFSLPLTGAFSAEGRKALDAYRFWAKKMNAKGGILIKGKRYPVALVYYDDKSNLVLNAKFYEKLITVDKVNLLLGGGGNPLRPAVGAVSDKFKYPLICGYVNSDKLFEQGFRYFFSVMMKMSDKAGAYVSMLKKLKPKPRRVAVIGSDSAPNAQRCKDFKESSEKAGLKVVHFDLFPAPLNDYSATVKKAMASHPDILFVGANNQGVLKGIFKAMKQVGFAPKGLVFNGGGRGLDSLKSMGRDGEYVFVTCGWLPALPYRDSVFGTAADFDKAFFREYHRHPDAVEAAAAAAAVVQQSVLRKTGLVPPYDAGKRETLAEQLHTLTFKTFFGNVRFGENGANSVFLPLIAQMRKGGATPVFPEAVRRAAPVYPMPGWGRRN